MGGRLEPQLGCDVYVAPTAYVGGQVVLGDQCTVMHHAVIRGDIAAIHVGNRVNVQDGAIVHTAADADLDISDDVGIGHRAIVHCRCIGTRTLIGMGAIVMDECEIGEGCIIGAGTVLPPANVIPDHSVVVGTPGRIVRDVTDHDLAAIDHVVQSYVRLGRLHGQGRFPNIAAHAANRISERPCDS